MILVAKALKIIERETASLGTELVKIEDVVGRVLAEDIIADSDMPPFDRSQMDGYAVRSGDVSKPPALLKLVGESAAGRSWKGTLKKGEAVRIMTGARVPSGADAVQKLEVAREKGDHVSILEPAAVGKFIVGRATEVQKGTVVLRKGEVSSPNSIAVPAAFGYSKVKVARRPRVAILATGSEIVDVNKKPKADQIRNSNSIMLAALCRKAGAEVTILPIAADYISELKCQISNAIKAADLLLMTGGVSVGKYDLTKTALKDLGAPVFFERVQLKPGKPTVFAKLKKTLVFGLPGNPVSASVTFYLFVRKAILTMQGATSTDAPVSFATAIVDIKGTQERDAYLPAQICFGFNTNSPIGVKPLKGHGSSDFTGFAKADALIVVPKGTNISSGEIVRVIDIT